ncbi:hypothetical protein [Bacillus sp. Y1]|nr:hypothetical protein [Bacillus sp. Y1]
MERLSNEQLEEIRKRAEATSFEKAYIKGDKWKGYEVKSDGNGVVIAEVSCGTDAEFIAHARQDMPKLLAEIERLRGALFVIYEDASDDGVILCCEEALFSGANL